jgi:hypothetical protein
MLYPVPAALLPFPVPFVVIDLTTFLPFFDVPGSGTAEDPCDLQDSECVRQLADSAAAALADLLSVSPISQVCDFTLWIASKRRSPL